MFLVAASLFLSAPCQKGFALNFAGRVFIGVVEASDIRWFSHEKLTAVLPEGTGVTRGVSVIQACHDFAVLARDLS